MRRAQLAAGLATVVLLGMLTAPAAPATDKCKPTHDPGHCRSNEETPWVNISMWGAEANLFVERSKETRSVTVHESMSYLSNMSGNGTEVHLWVSYTHIWPDNSTSPITTVLASTSDSSAPVGWSARGEDVMFQLCIGPGEDMCEGWY